MIKGKVGKQEASERFVDTSFEYNSNNINVCDTESTKKNSPPRLIDETVFPPTYFIKNGADLLKLSFAEYEKRSAVAGAEGANVEKLAENEVEGLVHTDSSETESDEFDPTKIAPTSYVSGKKKLKRSPKKKKASDEEDATYEPTPKEKKKVLKKRKARPSGAV
ncbi:hypothetical protein Hanom_Chr10g00925591 [Helianthus anomalus]